MSEDVKQHFSHEHMLIPMEPDADHEVKCQGCEDVIKESFYGCPACEYYLDTTCFDAPRSLQHPSHPSHPLSLFPTPTYSTRSFDCVACGFQCKTFSYACAQCEFDLHLFCAGLPQTVFVGHEENPLQLELVFEPPICSSTNHELRSCLVCNENLSNWLFYSVEYKQYMHFTCGPDWDQCGSGLVSGSWNLGKLETAADDLADGTECFFDCPSFHSDHISNIS